MAKQATTILGVALQLGVMANVLGANPVRDVQPLRAQTRPNGAVALTAGELRTPVAQARSIPVLPG
ncbi:hypothetical protein [Mycobacterium sp. 852013-50091_SCH5140682]|uniref:hypothetical protein n=1 Tax=Mycobacterium sp. 852013-50091_SCH5140682 TaxID=1834109 RepID=UPI000AC55351|nr:hypothetical protein [Mycobacterium sp. 852013-50091_SCH5140682]